MNSKMLLALLLLLTFVFSSCVPEDEVESDQINELQEKEAEEAPADGETFEDPVDAKSDTNSVLYPTKRYNASSGGNGNDWYRVTCARGVQNTNIIYQKRRFAVATVKFAGRHWVKVERKWAPTGRLHYRLRVNCK